VAWSDLTRDSFADEYWAELWDWYDAGGDSHVAAYLAELDIGTFNPKAPPPKTQAFWEIVLPALQKMPKCRMLSTRSAILMC
jgi:hypothetical protein